MAVKLFDSVAYGRRVIGNAGSLMGDWIEAKGWGWAVDDGDVRGLATALEEAAAALAGGRAAAALTSPPTWGAEAAKLVAAYETLAGRPR